MGGLLRGHLLDAEVVVLELDAARTWTVPAAPDFGQTAKIAGAEEILLKCTTSDSLDVLGAHQLPLLWIHLMSPALIRSPTSVAERWNSANIPVHLATFSHQQ